MAKTLKAPKTAKTITRSKAAAGAEAAAAFDQAAGESLVRRLARQGGLDHRTAEDLKDTFRAFIGEARGICAAGG